MNLARGVLLGALLIWFALMAINEKLKWIARAIEHRNEIEQQRDWER